MDSPTLEEARERGYIVTRSYRQERAWWWDCRRQRRTWVHLAPGVRWCRVQWDYEPRGLRLSDEQCQELSAILARHSEGLKVGWSHGRLGGRCQGLTIARAHELAAELLGLAERADLAHPAAEWAESVRVGRVGVT